ncbi:MAG TPA: isoprenyl transferase [Sphingomonadales bacterium]|nr:isoprenyl transferase [Sphingomonadales bacterium]
MVKPLAKLEPKRLPRHIAIIMDGNRRWALTRGLPRLAGHQKGIEAARRCVETCLERGIAYLTLYAFSSENWKRPPEEVNSLMGLLRLYLNAELGRMEATGVKVRVIGERAALPADIAALLDEAERRTAENEKLMLTLAINYGSHHEILTAIRRLAADAAAGKIAPEAIGEADVARTLETQGLPDPDLVIRTGGEKRLSNFLLWQSAYAELVFFDEHWPDFSPGLLEKAIREFQSRDRRFGARV